MSIRQELEKNKDYIFKEYENGKSCKKISQEFNCNSGTIWYFLDSYDLIKRKRSENYGNSRHIFEVIEPEFKSGMSCYEISKIHNIHVSTIKRILNRYGINTSTYSTQRNDPLCNHEEEIIKQYLSGDSTLEIAKKFNAGQSSIWRILDKNNIVCRENKKYSANYHFFDDIDSEEKAYILGFLYADGNNKKELDGIRIQIADLDILDKIKACIEYTGPYSIIKPRKSHHKTQYCLSICSRHMSETLVTKGCPPNKSLILKFPTDDIVPNKFINSFVRGYVDGDGNVGKYGRWKWQIVGTRHILDGISRVSDCVGYFNQRYPERLKDNWNFTIGKLSEFKKFGDWLYRDSTIYLNRKYDRYQQFLKECGVL